MTITEQEHFYSNLGSRIKVARKNAGITQDEVAGRMQLSRASIVNIEKGRQHPPIHTIWEMAKMFEVSISDLIPNYSPSNPVSPEWKKIVSAELKSKRVKETEKVLDFIGEIQTQKPS